MAQTAKAPRKKASSSSKSSSTKRTSSRASSNGTAKRKPAATRTKTSQTSKSSKSSGSTRSKSGSNGRSANGSSSIPAVALEKTKQAAHAAADVASKAKTPLIAGGTALAGVAAGAVAKDRLAKRSKGPLGKLRGVAKPATKLGELDLNKVKSTADRVTAYGQQASDIATAVQKARKKNKA